MIAYKERSSIPDLNRRPKEQVQLTGHIQPHGLLFALSEPDMLVKQVSTNVATLLGVSAESVLDRSFEAVLGAQEFALFRTQLLCCQLSFAATVHLPARDGVLEMECSAHRQGGVLIVELEPSQGGHSLGPLEFDAHVRIPLLRLRAASDLQELSRAAASEVRRLSGFARVMVYRFDKHWNGEVIAESVEPSPISYLGLRFPASDILPQVRQLFLLNPIRAIADVDATPAPILPTMNPLTEEALDLTLSALGSASPIHLECLRNMGAQSSLTFSILVKGRLWGMIACHNDKAHRLARSTRSVCELIVQTLAAQVAILSDNASLESRLTARTKRNEVAAGIAASESLIQAAQSQSTRLLELFDADGLISCIEGVVTSHGATLQTELLDPVIGKLQNLALRGVASCDELGKLEPDLATSASLVSGALYIDLAKIRQKEGSSDYLLFLRRELVQTISWAGNPGTAVLADQDERWHPRRSLESWQETVHGTSRPWTEAELESGLILRKHLLRLRSIDARKRAKRTLRESEERFRKACEYAPWGMAVNGLDGRFHLANTAFCNMLGYSKEQMSALTWREIIFPEDLSEFYDILHQLLQDPNQTMESEKRYFHSNGSVVWAHIKISLLMDNGAPRHFVVHTEDITGRRREAEALRASEERFRTMSDCSRTIMWVSDSAGNVEFINRAFREFFGLTSEELQGGKVSTLIHPDDAPEYVAVFERAVREQAPFSLESRFRRVDGEWRLVGTRAEPRFFPGGEYRGHLGTSADITERMQAKETRERLAAIVDSSDDAIISKSLDGRITAWNRGAEKVFGYSAAEIVGTPILTLLPPDRIDEESDILARVRLGEGVKHFETVRLRKGGTKVDVSVTISPIRDSKGVIVGASNIARDITERKLAEQVLRSSEEKFRQLAENINQVFWMMNPAGTEILYVGPAYEQIWGRTCKSLYEAPMDRIEAISPEDREHARETFMRQLQGENIDSEYRISTPDGQERWIRDRAFPVRNHDGQIVMIAGIAEEITERKQYEKEALNENVEKYAF